MVPSPRSLGPLPYVCYTKHETLIFGWRMCKYILDSCRPLMSCRYDMNRFRMVLMRIIQVWTTFGCHWQSRLSSAKPMGSRILENHDHTSNRRNTVFQCRWLFLCKKYLLSAVIPNHITRKYIDAIGLSYQFAGHFLKLWTDCASNRCPVASTLGRASTEPAHVAQHVGQAGLSSAGFTTGWVHKCGRGSVPVAMITLVSMQVRPELGEFWIKKNSATMKLWNEQKEISMTSSLRKKKAGLAFWWITEVQQQLILGLRPVEHRQWRWPLLGAQTWATDPALRRASRQRTANLAVCQPVSQDLVARGST